MNWIGTDWHEVLRFVVCYVAAMNLVDRLATKLKRSPWFDLSPDDIEALWSRSTPEGMRHEASQFNAAELYKGADTYERCARMLEDLRRRSFEGKSPT